LRARLSVCEAISMTGLLRAFSPRNDKGGSHCELVFPPGEAISYSLVLRLLRFARSDAQGVPASSSCCPFLCLRARHFALSSVIASRVFFALFLVIASLAFLSGEAISLSVPKAGHCELVVSFAKQSPSSLCGNTRLLRAFGPRNDEQKESLRASFVRLAKQSRETASSLRSSQ